MVKPIIRWVAVLCMATVFTVLSAGFALAQADAPVDDVQGALIVGVIANSPASEAGIVRGDVILAVDDEPVNSSADLRALVPAVTPGELVSLTIRHGDETFIVDVELGDQDGNAFLGVYLARDLEVSETEEAQPEPADESAAEEPAEGSDEDMAEAAGPEEADAEEVAEEAIEEAAEEVEETPEAASMEDAAGEEEEAEETESGEMEDDASDDADEEGPEVFGMMPYTDTAGGAIIFRVVDGSPADDAGIQMGDVILGVDGERLQRASELAEAVDDRAPGDTLTLEMLRRTGELENVDVILGEHPDDAESAFLGIGFLPTPRRMFLGHGPNGDVLVPPMPFFFHGPDFDGPNRWHPRAQPYHNWDECDGMPWWACEDEEDEDMEQESPESKGDDNALSALDLAA